MTTRTTSPVVPIFALLILVASTLGFSRVAHAQYGIGDISLSDFLIEPEFVYSEKKEGSFSAGGSYLKALWTKDAVISGDVKIGSTQLLGRPARYGTVRDDSVGLIEAYAQADVDYGRFRLGLVPIPFGLEGGDAETRIRFPRSLPFQARFIGLRDYGLSYRIFNNGFFVDWAIHNGEGGTDLDHQVWMTGRWGWQGGQFLRLGFSGSTGRTTPASTNRSATNTSDQAFMDVTQGSRIRVANFFFDWQLAPFRLELEVNQGLTRQTNQDVEFRSARADLEWQPTKSFSTLARYDWMDPQSTDRSKQLYQITAGVAWHGDYDSSVLYLLGSKESAHDQRGEAHRAMLIWRITPQALNSRSAL